MVRARALIEVSAEFEDCADAEATAIRHENKRIRQRVIRDCHIQDGSKGTILQAEAARKKGKESREERKESEGKRGKRKGSCGESRPRLSLEPGSTACQHRQRLLDTGFQRHTGINHGLGQSDRLKPRLHLQIKLEITIARGMLPSRNLRL